MIEAITAAKTETATYLEASTFDFQVSKKKRVDRNLNVFFVSIQDMYQRQWSFVIPSSPCFIILTAMYEGKAQNFCPLLCSMYGDTTNLSEPVPMLVFLEHINKISLALQKKMCTIDNVQNSITSSLYHIPCVVKLLCIYSTSQRCGLSYEVIETFPGV